MLSCGRGDREAEGAALEMPCTLTRTEGSNPSLSAENQGFAAFGREPFFVGEFNRYVPFTAPPVNRMVNRIPT